MEGTPENGTILPLIVCLIMTWTFLTLAADSTMENLILDSSRRDYKRIKK